MTAVSGIKRRSVALGQHIPALDGLRGIAILMTVVYHYFRDQISQPGLRPIKFAGVGVTGVDLFFVLSGFLITGIILRERSKPRFLRNFYARRILRIFPLYYAFIAFITWWHPFPFETKPLSWMYWVFLQNVGGTFSGLEPQYLWSLAVEEHFYLFWPFVVLWLPAKALPRVLGGVFVVAMVLRVLMLRQGLMVTQFTLVRIDTLAAGALVAVLIYNDALEPWLRWVPHAVAGLAVVGLAAFPLLSGRAVPALEAIKGPVTALVYATFLALIVVRGTGASLLSIAPLRFFGKYSYAMYLVHEVFLPWGWSLSRWPGLLLVLTATTGTAIASWYLLEQPCLSLKRHFEYLLAPRGISIR